jgi:radical SAM protein with 4Fe4S-binding SPASM domain
MAKNMLTSSMSRIESLLPIGLRRPRTLSIEPTSRCNLNCPFCLVGQQNSLPNTGHDLLPRGLGDMDWELYKKILDDAVEFGITKIQLHFQGEPLLYKKFPDMVKAAKAAGLFTQAFTNGLPLTQEKTSRIIQAGLDSLRFSVDGATQSTYEKNRVGGKLDHVLRNMRIMVEEARNNGSKIELLWQFIALQNNEHEIEVARGLAKDIGIPFFVKTFAETDEKLAPSNPKLRRKLRIKPCIDIYRAIFVYHTGEVVPCCYDQEGENVVGSLKNSSLKQIWYSERYQDLRERINNAEKNPRAEPNMCKNCLKWTSKTN